MNAVHCLRCNAPCRTGTPDATKRYILQSATIGFCPNCMIQKFLLSIENIAETIEGTPERGDRQGVCFVPARPGIGPEILLGDGAFQKQVRQIVANILTHTQMPADSINWIEVVGNWGLPWPKGRQPKPGSV